jgi:hypothetical protein
LRPKKGCIRIVRRIVQPLFHQRSRTLPMSGLDQRLGFLRKAASESEDENQNCPHIPASRQVGFIAITTP